VKKLCRDIKYSQYILEVYFTEVTDLYVSNKYLCHEDHRGSLSVCSSEKIMTQYKVSIGKYSFKFRFLYQGYDGLGHAENALISVDSVVKEKSLVPAPSN